MLPLPLPHNPLLFCVYSFYICFSLLAALDVPLVASQPPFHLPSCFHSICFCCSLFFIISVSNFQPIFFPFPLKDFLLFLTRPSHLSCLTFLVSRLSFLQHLVPFLSICAEIFPWQQLGDGENRQISATESVVVPQTGERGRDGA